MAKIKLSTEQVLAGALALDFDFVTDIDLILLMEDFLRYNGNYDFTADEEKYLDEYITTNDGKVTLKPGLNMESTIEQNNCSLRERLNQIAGPHIRKYLESFNFELFILKKIETFGEMKVNSIDSILCKKELEKCKELCDKGYIKTLWNGDAIYDDEEVVSLSSIGKLRLFKLYYAREIEIFIEQLKSLRYDVSLLDDFLLKQDLDDQIWGILDINNLEQFCNDYDRAKLVPGVSNVYFKELESKKETIVDDIGKKGLQDMLSIFDEGHSIYVCHPNHIFAGEKLLTQHVYDIKHVNWNDLDIEKMFSTKQYETFIHSSYEDAFKYVHNRLRQQIIQEIRKGIDKKEIASYLVVIERYEYDHEDNYLVRGIIKGDYRGYSLAFNPEYKKVISNTIVGNSIKFFGNEVPNVYTLKNK